jgi:hypothetical protein
MKKLSLLGVALALAANAYAAPNVTNVTQKGSLLLWPDIRIDDGWNTLVRIQNDGSQDVDVKCYWMDGNKNRVDFVIPVTRNQPLWLDARTGNGTYQVNMFPQSAANGIDNPWLLGPFAAPIPAATGQGGLEALDNSGPYLKGLLICWAVDNGGQNQVKWNHLSGTATVYHPGFGAYEYNAYAFFVPTGLDLEPVGTAGTINLNGVEYDSCPQYMIGQFSPVDAATPPPVAAGNTNPNAPPPANQPVNVPTIFGNRLAVAGCTLNLNQDWTPVWTKLQFTVWNEDEIPFTGAYECSDSWHETTFMADNTPWWTTPPFTAAGIEAAGGGWIDSAGQNFQFSNLGTYSARYRIQGVASSQCNTTNPTRTTSNVGVVAVQSSWVGTTLPAPAGASSDMVGTTLAAAGKFTGRIVWDPSGVVPEGGLK